MQAAHGLNAEHLAQSALQSGIVILKCQIKHLALPDRIIPEWQTHRHMVTQLCHEEGFADLWASGEQVSPALEQSLYDRSLRDEDHVIEIGQRYGFEAFRRMQVSVVSRDPRKSISLFRR